MAPTTTSPVVVPTTAPSTIPTTSLAPVAAARATAPAVGVRPAVGTPAPVLPASTRPLAAIIRNVGRMLKVEVVAPKGALVHVYKDGQLVKSVTPEEAKSLSMPANGSSTEDLQVVVVTRTGEVMSTPADSGSKATTRTTVSTSKSRSKSGSSAPGRSSSGKSGQRSTTDTVKPSTK